MSRCGCGTVDSCQCYLSGGDGVSVSGGGSAGDPYVLNPIIDPDADNGLSLGVSGLMIPRGMEVINEQLLLADTGSIIFSNIPQTYRNLHLVAQTRSARVEVYDDIELRINGDTGTNYNWTRLLVGTAVSVDQGTAATSIHVGFIPGANGNANRAGGFWIDIPDYSRATYTKNIFSKTVSWHTDALNDGQLRQTNGFWSTQAAITSLTILSFVGSNLKAGSVFTLYGLYGLG